MPHRLTRKTTATRCIAVILCVATLLLTMPFVPVSAVQGIVTQVNNLVLFAQFDRTAGYNFMDGRADKIVALCNSREMNRSLASYIHTISYGQMETTCYFPQLADGEITPYTLAEGQNAYSDEAFLVLETLANVTIPDDLPLDGNGDGVIDNIILVVDGAAQSTGEFLWPKKFDLYGSAVGDLITGTVNIQNSKSLFEDTISGDVGVLCHEFMHSIGYPDLYRQTEGTPVGAWDIMASVSIFLQYPLAYQRAAVSGWLAPTECRENGRYTLNPASSDSGDRVLLLRTPLSDTEFFAVEYRKKGTQFTDEMDVKIYGTGLVVYRINKEVLGNYQEQQDEIYVFRPGETAVEDAAGDLFSSCFGGTGAPTQIGSSDFSDTIADGALVYSDGTNSGIQISNMQLSEERAAFDVTFADTTGAALWQTAGVTSHLGEISSFDLAATDQTPYLAASDGRSVRVSYLVDGQWRQLGDAIGGGSYGAVNQVRLALCGETPYVLYCDASYCFVLCGWNAAAGVWEEKARSKEPAQYTDLAAADGKVFVCYTIGDLPYALHLGQFDSATDTYFAGDDVLAGNACNVSMVCTASGQAVIAFRDLNDGDRPKAVICGAGTATTVTLSQHACGSVSATVSGDTVTVAASGYNAAELFTLEQETVTSLALPADAESFTQVPLAVDGTLYLIANSIDPAALKVYCRNRNDWVPLGNALTTTSVYTEPCAVQCGGRLFVAYQTESELVQVKQFALGGKSVLRGDVNQDGVISVADVVLLQKSLLQQASLTAAQAMPADFDENGKINGFDLSQLKRMLLRRQG